MKVLIALFLLVLLLINPVFFIIALIVVGVLGEQKKYKEGTYYQVTHHPYFSMRGDKGLYGEYLTYKYLKHFENDGAKFLFNIYLPKENGETIEIDVLMISPKGVFVFESKNYSGWIFGSENQKNWYQTLPAGRGKSRKEHFYNPIMQNRTHIKHLKAFLGEQVPMHSVIVFSERCTLKNIKIESNDISVIKRYDISSVVAAICDQISVPLLNENDISDIYNKLYPFTQVDETTKVQHIMEIQSNLTHKPAQTPQPTRVPLVDAVQKDKTSQESVVTQTDPDPTNMMTTNEKVQASVTDILDNQPIEVASKTPQEINCPWCNGHLVLRTATRGINAGNQFYGCSNYPRCKYIQNISTNQTV